jgi:hypothetical protein
MNAMCASMSCLAQFRIWYRLPGELIALALGVLVLTTRRRRAK